MPPVQHDSAGYPPRSVAKVNYEVLGDCTPWIEALGLDPSRVIEVTIKRIGARVEILAFGSQHDLAESLDAISIGPRPGFVPHPAPTERVEW
jgi:hypothetical protein